MLCLVAGCDWAGGTTQTVVTVPGPSTAIQLAPQLLNFTAASSATQTISVSENAYSGTFSVSGCTGIATTVWTTTTSLSVTEMGGGSCVLTIADTKGQSAYAAVTVTSVSIPIESSGRR